MQHKISDIHREIYDHFSKKYKAFGDFVDSGELWDACITAISDATLLSHIIFCNDIHQIPPVHTFLRVRQKQNALGDLSELEKRSIGAFWGFVFKFIFGYRNQKRVTARVNTVKTATYFFDLAGNIEIISYKERGCDK